MLLFLKGWVPEIGLFDPLNNFMDAVKVKDFPKPSHYKILLFHAYWKILDWRQSEAKLDLVFKNTECSCFCSLGLTA